MGLWQILKGEQPGLIKSLLHYRNAGQFGEYLAHFGCFFHTGKAKGKLQMS